MLDMLFCNIDKGKDTHTYMYTVLGETVPFTVVGDSMMSYYVTAADSDITATVYTIA